MTPEWAYWALVVATLGIAVVFKPWLVLKHQPLQNPWLAAMMVLPWVWWLQQLLPSGVALRLGGICLLVLMVGWPLAMCSLPLIAAVTSLMQIWGPRFGHSLPPTPTPVWEQWLDLWFLLGSTMFWTGVVPGTLALGIGLAIRRWAPKHLFVYILGRGFFGTALAISLTGVLGWLAGRVPISMNTEEWLLGHWLLGWGEAISTGMLTAIFVAFKPHWLLTYSDARYLPRDNRPL